MRKSTKIIIGLVLCIPLVAAIMVGVLNKAPKPKEKNELKVINVTTPEGKNLSFNDSESLMAYKNVIEHSKEITDPAFEKYSQEFTVEFGSSVKNGDVSYVFILSNNPSACIFKDVSEKYYLIDKEYASALLVRDEFKMANPAAVVPSMLFAFGSNTVEVQPEAFEWQYSTIGGEKKTDSKADDTKYDTLIVPAESASMTMTLENDPEVDVKVTDASGATVYEGKPDGVFTKISEYKADTELKVSVNAVWVENAESESFGNAQYIFNVLYDVKSKFKYVDDAYIRSRNGLSKGEFTFIEVLGGNKDEVITATSDLFGDDKVLTSFVNAEGRQFIFAPICVEAAVGDHKIIVKEIAGETELSLKVNNRLTTGTKNGQFDVNDSKNNIQSNIDEFISVINGLNEKSSNTQLWNGKFKKPVAYSADSSLACKFGDEMNIMADAGEEKIYCDGIYIPAAKGTTVAAANNGIVLFAGENAYAGNMVVIDHGHRVLSYYMNLDSVTCQVGKEVKSGDAIGTAGSTGVSPFDGTLYYANSVDGCFVNPANQIAHGVTFG